MKTSETDVSVRVSDSKLPSRAAPSSAQAGLPIVVPPHLGSSFAAHGKRAHTSWLCLSFFHVPFINGCQVCSKAGSLHIHLSQYLAIIPSKCTTNLRGCIEKIEPEIQGVLFA